MRFAALACDYDGTIALHGAVDEPTVAALERLRASGRKLLLVSGRELPDLERVFPRLDLFDRLVLENGALVIGPDGHQRQLGEAPPAELVARLRGVGVERISIGRVILATWEPHETAVFQAIRDLGLEHQVIFNKGAVMVLPPGINKATGLEVALRELGLTRHEVVGVGDAENDHAFLGRCECAVAVSNALPFLKERVDLVTRADHGAGVTELVDRMLADDLRSLEPRLSRHQVLLGARYDGTEARVPPHGAVVLVTGPSASGNSKVAAALIERAQERGYQVCVIDAEGEHRELQALVGVGDAEHAPSVTEVSRLLENPDESVDVDLSGVEPVHRPALLDRLMPRIRALRAAASRPHWLVVDPAAHLAPASLPGDPGTVVLVSARPESVAPALLARVDLVIAVGVAPEATLGAFARASGRPPPASPGGDATGGGHALVWHVREGAAERVAIAPPSGERRRERRSAPG